MSDTTEAQVPEVTSAPETVATPSDEQPTPQDAGTEDKGTKTQGQENRIPQSRFNEVIAERQAYAEEVEALRGKIEEIDQDRSKLVDLLDNQKEDIALITNLRNLATTTQDQEVKQAIDLLDATMSGTRDQIEAAADEKVAEGSLTREAANKLVSEQTSMLEDKINEQRAEMLFGQANSKAERLLQSLPDEYLDEDKRVIAEAWIRRVDWDTMEEDPNTMDDLLVNSLQETTDWYGEPRGSLRKAAEEVPVTEDGEPITTPSEPTPEEEIAKLNEVKWSEIGDDGQPVYSDEIFSQAMANALRAVNRGKE